MFENVKYTRLAEAGDGTDPTLEVTSSDGKAFSFDSAFKYDHGVKDTKYRSSANYNSAFKYSGNAIPKRHERSVGIDMASGMNGAYMDEDFYERSRTPYGLIITSWFLTFFSYVFFVFTSPIT